MANERKGSAVKGNGFDEKQVAIWYNNHKKLCEEKQEAHMSYMSRCAKINERIKDNLEAAQNAGIPRKAITDQFKIEKLEARIDELKNPEDEEHGETLEQFRHALGVLDDTPLGQAATEKKKAKGMPGADAPASMN